MKFLAGFAAIASLLSSISPVSAHSRHRNPLRSVGHITNADFPSNRVHAHSSFQLTFTLGHSAPRIRFALEPNHDVLADGATISYLGHDGSVERTETINRFEHRVFKGTAFLQYPGDVEWTNVGWARIHVHRDGPRPLFEGAFVINGDHHHVQTSENFRQTRLAKDPQIERRPEEYMIFWRDSDIIGNEQLYPGVDELKRSLGEKQSCAAGELLFNRDENHPIYRGTEIEEKRSIRSDYAPSAWSRRQLVDGTTSGNSAGVNLVEAIGSTAGCPTSRKVALIGVATDCTYTADFANDTAVRTNIINQINTASQVYESTFNISLGIQNLTISPKDCPAEAAAEAPWNVGCDVGTIETRLNDFSLWRGQHVDSNAYWTLLSTCNTDSAVGLAWLGQLCMAGSDASGNETVASANVVVRTSAEWQVFAHESAHTFGAVHDCTSSSCSDGTATLQQCCPLSASTCDADGQYLMNPSTGNGFDVFSQCTIGNICSALGRQSVQSNCLANNRDVVTITGSQCGNGIVETGEECDCGGEAGCAGNTCCEPTTCTFTTGSVCDASNEECCDSQCQFASSGTVCRSSTGSCDPEETCTGTSSTCPSDLSSPDGTGCGSNGLQCASGQCTSRNQQCQTLMGSLSSDNDTQSCDSSGCQISCSSASFGNNVCYTLNQNFLDGTPCQGGGQCSNGACKGSSTTEEVKSWIEDNKRIVIPVASVVGLLIIMAVFSCIISAIRRSRARKRLLAARNLKPVGSAGYGQIQSPPLMRGAGGSRSRSHGSRTRGSLPNEPPPAYTGRQMTTRYA